MSLNKEPLPCRETAQKQVSPNSNVSQDSSQDLLALEALRSALCASGIYHDCLDYIAQRCLDGLKAGGLVAVAVNHEAAGRERDAAADLQMCEAARPGPWEVRNDNEDSSHPPFWVIGRDVDEDNEEAMQLHVGDLSTAEFVASSRTALPYWIARCVTAERKPTFRDIEAAVSSVLPDVHFTRNLNAHPASYRVDPAHCATLAQAQEAAAAIIAQYGGSVNVRHYDEGRKGDALGDVKVETHGIEIGIFFFSEEPPCAKS